MVNIQSIRDRFFSLNPSLIQIIFVMVSLLLFASTPKTPNFGWMGVYQLPTFPDLFTGIPVFKPWIPIERFEYSIHESLWISENIGYAFFSYLSLMFFYTKSRLSKRENCWWFLFVPFLVVMFFASWGGTIYDVIFAYALIYCLDVLLSDDLESAVNLGYSILLLAFVDLARPYGFPLFIFLLCGFAFKYKEKVFWPLLLILPLIFLFHLAQFVNYGTILLTVYSGMNLYEVFPFASHNCMDLFGRNQIDTVNFLVCDQLAKSEIIEQLMAEPSKILNTLKFDRMINFLFPYPFWHGTGLHAVQSEYLKSFGHLYKFFIFSIFFMAVLSLTISKKMIIVVFIYLYIAAVILFSHGMTELPRVILPLIFICLYVPFVKSGNKISATPMRANC